VWKVGGREAGRGSREGGRADGAEKSTTVNGQPGWEKWDSENKQGEVNALVGKRFLVTIEGSGIDGVQVLQDVASKMDFNRLASLK
jgi:hypothetical protein